MKKKLLAIMLAIAMMATVAVVFAGCNINNNYWQNPYFEPVSRDSFDDYTDEFFENNTLVLVCTMTSSGGFPSFMSLSAVVPNENGELVFVFSLNLPNGNLNWTANIGYVMVFAEIPNAVLEKYSFGRVITVGGGRSFNQAPEWLDDRLPYQIEFGLAPPITHNIHTSWDGEGQKFHGLAHSKVFGSFATITSMQQLNDFLHPSQDATYTVYDYNFWSVCEAQSSWWTIPNFERSHSWWNIAFDRYRVYIDRNSRGEFVYISTVSPWNLSANNAVEFLSLTSGYYTVRVISNQQLWTLNNNAPYFGYSVGYWQFEFKTKSAQHLVMYPSLGIIESLRWCCDLNSPPPVNIYSASGEKVNASLIGSSVPFSVLGLSEGSNTIKVELQQDRPFYRDGVLYYGRHYGIWQANLKIGSNSNYNFRFTGTDDNTLWWDGINTVPYRVYVNRHSRNGFVYSHTTSSSFSMHMTRVAYLNLSRGNNTVRVVSTRNTWNYRDGILRYGISGGEFDIQR